MGMGAKSTDIAPSNEGSLWLGAEQSKETRLTIGIKESDSTSIHEKVTRAVRIFQ